MVATFYPFFSLFLFRGRGGGVRVHRVRHGLVSDGGFMGTEGSRLGLRRVWRRIHGPPACGGLVDPRV